ncbi:hypothetical protein GCM10025868_21610 [Angustibacter aerolatus]|uniref:Major facilitator superfamily (MFS) profile domain-containing protein n=1 Tax=Angustibacter aerolatus TaxID=1162965 RepID=A0ABQ6JH83_9ACTN|nr:hypothetical protein GCM10025868_21610 [Angustibacter aerolatus]
MGSGLAGLSQDTGTLIAFRAVQGLGAGGLTALATVVMADIVSPRERGRYMGLLGAVMAVGTVGGPLLGGVLTDTVGWRWNFYVGVPVAAAAIIVLQRTLHLPTRRREGVRIDYLGAVLVSAAVSLLLVWVTLGGTSFAWGSWQTAAMVGGAALLTALFVVAEVRAAEPLLPLEPVPQPHRGAGRRRQRRGRRRDVRHLGVPQPVHAGGPRQDAHPGRPAHHPAHRRSAHRLDGGRPGSSAAPASGSATSSPARCCSSSACRS